MTLANGITPLSVRTEARNRAVRAWGDYLRAVESGYLLAAARMALLAAMRAHEEREGTDHADDSRG